MNSADLDIIQREADAAARRLARRLDLSADARCDICQELLVDLLARIDRRKWDHHTASTVWIAVAIRQRRYGLPDDGVVKGTFPMWGNDPDG